MKKIFFITFIYLIFPLTARAETYRVLTFNFKYIKPHNINILKSCLQSRNIDFFGHQEMNFRDGTNIDSMKASLAEIGYRTDDIIATYSPSKQERLTIFYKNKFQLVEGLQESVIGGGAGQKDDTRKIITVKVKDSETGRDIRLFNHHPVSGDGEPSCDHNKNSIAFVNQFNDPNSIFFGDFNLFLNATDPAQKTSCNEIYDNQFQVSCRPEETSQHTSKECAGKYSSHFQDIDFVTTKKSSRLSMVDSWFDYCGFSIGGSGSNDSDHVPLIAVIQTNDPPTPCSLKVKGDADCNNVINQIDYTCWKTEFLNLPKLDNCVSGDFDNKEGVSILDYAIWFSNYVKTLIS